MDDEIKSKVTVYNQDSNYPKEIMSGNIIEDGLETGGFCPENCDGEWHVCKRPPKNITPKSFAEAVEIAKCKAKDLRLSLEQIKEKEKALERAKEYSKWMHEEYTQATEILFAALYAESRPLEPEESE